MELILAVFIAFIQKLCRDQPNSLPLSRRQGILRLLLGNVILVILPEIILAIVTTLALNDVVILLRFLLI